jgi:hypothetical protein
MLAFVLYPILSIFYTRPFVVIHMAIMDVIGPISLGGTNMRETGGFH